MDFQIAITKHLVGYLRQSVRQESGGVDLLRAHRFARHPGSRWPSDHSMEVDVVDSPRTRTLFFSLLCAFLAAVIGVATSTPASAATLYVDYNFVDGVAVALLHPSAAPPGANDWSCKPSANHPRPVVLVHGTLSNMEEAGSAISPLLKNTATASSR